AWLYRVFLLANSLQVDLAFAPHGEFGARAPTFRLLFGIAAEPRQPQPGAPTELVGLAWLYALHVRSASARGTLWQAEHMLRAARDHVLAAACRRLGLPSAEGRGIDQLPDAVTAPLRVALVAHLEPSAIVRAFEVVIEQLIQEARRTDAALADRTAPALR